MNEVVKQLSLIGIVPVIKIDNAADAKPLAKALIDGGLPCAEVTFRTACAKEAIFIGIITFMIILFTVFLIIGINYQ